MSSHVWTMNKLKTNTDTAHSIIVGCSARCSVDVLQCAGVLRCSSGYCRVLQGSVVCCRLLRRAAVRIWLCIFHEGYVVFKLCTHTCSRQCVQRVCVLQCCSVLRYVAECCSAPCPTCVFLYRHVFTTKRFSFNFKGLSQFANEPKQNDFFLQFLKCV